MIESGIYNYIHGQIKGLAREVNIGYNGSYEPGYIAEKLRNIARSLNLYVELSEDDKLTIADLIDNEIERLKYKKKKFGLNTVEQVKFDRLLTLSSRIDNF